MAALTQDSQSETVHPLRARVLIGRAPHCDLVVASRKASGEHAVLVWEGGQWGLRDLGSRNGTWTSRERLRSGGRVVVRPGDQLFFGTHDEVWTLSGGGPELFATRRDGGPPILGESGMLALPSLEAVQVTVYQDDRGQWVADRAGAIEAVSDRGVLAVDGLAFELALPHALPPTEESELSLFEARFAFGVSGNEEYVELEIIQGARRRTIQPRAHLYVLLTLARLRLEQEADDSEGAAGWVHQEDLAHMLGCNDAYINLAIFKARKQLAKAGLVGAPGVIERRVGTRQLRFGAADVSVRML
ncbi:MAG TPA: hypothetical protein DFR83_19130 [Deltaproteobacteria bacterium]|nr:hypothetical protein [Deltaproteobacteria bacterium]